MFYSNLKKLIFCLHLYIVLYNLYPTLYNRLTIAPKTNQTYNQRHKRVIFCIDTVFINNYLIAFNN